ncbi:MAG: hypothetical protein QXH71_01025 [Candidatus Anstonellaceae archaeon]
MELLQQPQQQNTTQLSRELENSISKLENLLKNTSTALPTAILEGWVNEISSKLKNLKDSNTPLDDSLKKRLQDLYSNPLLKPLIEKSEFESLWPKAEKDDKKTPSSLENIRTVEAVLPVYILPFKRPIRTWYIKIEGSFNPYILKDPNALDFHDLNRSLLNLAYLVSGAEKDTTFFEQYLSLLNDKIKYLKDKYGNQFNQEFNSFLADLQSSVNSKDHTRFSTLAEQFLKKDSYFKNLEIEKQMLVATPFFTLGISKSGLFTGTKKDKFVVEFTGYLFEGDKDLYSPDSVFSFPKTYFGLKNDMSYYYPIGPFFLGANLAVLFSPFQKGISKAGLSFSNESKGELLPSFFYLELGFDRLVENSLNMQVENLGKTLNEKNTYVNKSLPLYLNLDLGWRALLPFLSSYKTTVNTLVDIYYNTSNFFNLNTHGSFTFYPDNNFSVTFGVETQHSNRQENPLSLSLYFNLSYNKYNVSFRYSLPQDNNGSWNFGVRVKF